MGMCRLIATHFLVLPGVIGGDGADAGGRVEENADTDPGADGGDRRSAGAPEGHSGGGTPVTTDSRGRMYWNVEHPEARLRLVVPARTEDEARALAWRRWYGREPTTEFDDRLRAAFSVTDSGEPVE